MTDRWIRAACIALLALLACAYAAGVMAPGYGLSHDDGIYLVTAKALATGQGYRILSLPEAIAQTKYPPLFPALLALIWKIYPVFPANLWALKLLPLTAGIVWLWLAHKLLRREGMPVSMALAAITLTAATGWTYFLGITLFSETVFAVLFTLALLMLRRAEQRGESAFHSCLTGIVIGLTLLTRSSGVALLAAAIAALACQRRFRQTLFLCVTAMAVYAPWLWWVHSHPYSGRLTEAYYTSENYRAWNVIFSFNTAEKLAVLRGNLVHLAGGLPSLLQLPYVLWAILLIPAAAALSYGMFRAATGGSARSLPTFVVFYFGLSLVWAWPPERFLAVVLPFLFYFYWVAAARFRQKRWFQASLAAAAVLVAANLGAARFEGRRLVLRNGADSNYHWESVRAMAEWIDRSTPKDAILVSALDPTLYLATGRRALRGFELDPVALSYSGDEQRNPPVKAVEMIREIIESRATHLVVASIRGGHDIVAHNRAIQEMLQAKPAAFRQVYQGPSGYRVYDIDRRALE